MVRNTLILNKASGIAVAAMTLLAPAFIINNTNALACQTTNGIRTCEETGTFQVSVDEILTVDVAKPDTWADSTGEVSQFLTNKVSLTVSTNNTQGFQASMTTNTESATGVTGTDLINQSDNTYKIATLSSTNVAPANFPTTGAWGFGLTASKDASSADVLAAPTAYNPLVAKNATPSVVLSYASAASRTADIYFGAKGDTANVNGSTTTPSGIYASTVLISVVSGVHDDNTPVTPTDPTTPVDPTTNPTDPTNPNTPSDGEVAYNNNTTTYTNTYTSGTGSTSTTHTYSEITSGDNRSNYNGYAYPQGETVATVNQGSPLATGLAITAAVAATAGVVFFIVAKRRDDDDEEEEDF